MCLVSQLKEEPGMEWKDIDDAVFLITAEDLFDFDRRDEPRTARITG
jgi:hypothetical protein